MVSRAPLSIIDRGTTVVVRGNAMTVLRDGGFRGLYVGTVRGWILDGHRLPDLTAYLDSRRIPFEVAPRTEVAPRSSTSRAPRSSTSPREPDPDDHHQVDRDDRLPERELFNEVIS